ncbi:MAG: DUF4253 domain-containing protein [Planctomycetaceae bacterium]|nr:DUF4253 domain-containing protein [Planctomycetaceae bacterium]
MSGDADQFAELRDKQTNGINYGHSTDDVIARLKRWDERFGIKIVRAEHDLVELELNTLPDDLDAFVREIYQFCPDTVSQGFGCFEEAYGDLDSDELPEGVAELVEGIDFDDDDYGLEIMKRAIQRDRKIGLWWD